MENWKSDLEMQIQFILEDFENKTNDIQVSENKLVILFELEKRSERKHLIKKWSFIGVVLGMVIIRLLEFILPNT